MKYDKHDRYRDDLDQQTADIGCCQSEVVKMIKVLDNKILNDLYEEKKRNERSAENCKMLAITAFIWVFVATAGMIVVAF